MNIEKLTQEFNVRRCLRDSLPTCKAEMEILEEDENVQKYLRLQQHYAQYESLAKKNDDTILDEIIENDIIEGDPTYFCYGKDFIGHPKKVGGYYIDHGVNPINRLQGTRVTRYQNLLNPADEVIIPSVEAEAFEKEHKVIFHTTDNPVEEYQDKRRIIYKKQIRLYEHSRIPVEEPKRLVKEPNND